MRLLLIISCIPSKPVYYLQFLELRPIKCHTIIVDRAAAYNLLNAFDTQPAFPDLTTIGERQYELTKIKNS